MKRLKLALFIAKCFGLIHVRIYNRLEDLIAFTWISFYTYCISSLMSEVIDGKYIYQTSLTTLTDVIYSILLILTYTSKYVTFFIKRKDVTEIIEYLALNHVRVDQKKLDFIILFNIFCILPTEIIYVLYIRDIMEWRYYVTFTMEKHLEVLFLYVMKELVERIKVNYKSLNVKIKCKEQAIECIEKYRELNEISKKLNNLYSVPIIMFFAFATVSFADYAYFIAMIIWKNFEYLIAVIPNVLFCTYYAYLVVYVVHIWTSLLDEVSMNAFAHYFAIR